MITLSEVSDDGSLRDMDAAELSPASLSDGVIRWVRLVEPAPSEWQAVAGSLGLSQEVSEAFRGADATAWCDVREGVLLMAFPVLSVDDFQFNCVRVIYISNMLITVEDVRLPAVDRIARQQSHRAGPTSAVLPELLLDLLESAARGKSPPYLSMRGEVNSLDDQLEDSPLDVPMEALLTMKRRIALVAVLLEDQGYCFLQLQNHLGHQAEAGVVRERLRELLAEIDRGMTLFAALASRVRDLRQHYSHCLQEATNRRLNTLTVLSAVYLPATLIAGIFGMNFANIPLTELRYGYFVAIIFMIVLVLGQFVFFYRRGWFK